MAHPPSKILGGWATESGAHRRNLAIEPFRRPKVFMRLIDAGARHDNVTATSANLSTQKSRQSLACSRSRLEQIPRTLPV